MRHSVCFIALSFISWMEFCVAHEIIPGLEYAHFAYEHPAQSIHILTADPRRLEVAMGIADNKCAGAQTVLVIAQQQDGVAAVNGGFFDFGCAYKIEEFFLKLLDCFGYSKYFAYPMWTVASNKCYYSLTSSKLSFFTGAIAWNGSDQKPVFNAIKSHVLLQINNDTIPVDEFNKPHPSGIALYTSAFDSATPAFRDAVSEIVIENNRIVDISYASHGKTAIPHNGAILALNHEHTTLREIMHIGDSAQITIFHEQKPDIAIANLESFWNSAENIVASTPLLLLQREIPEYLKTRASSFYTKRHPRTAVGILENGHWIFVVVDGRSSQAEGFTMLELAEFMREFGCVNALNLDGGGSSTMVINNTVINNPAGEGLVRKEQPVSNALVLRPKKLTDQPTNC